MKAILLALALSQAAQSTGRDVGADISNRRSNAGTGTQSRRLKERFADEVRTRDYATFAQAVAAVNDSCCTLVIQDRIQLTEGSYTIAAPVVFSGQGAIDVSTGSASVTISGAITAPLNQVFFAGTGTISIGSAKVAAVYPQWWGAQADWSHDDTPAIQAAIDAAAGAGARVVFPAGTYRIVPATPKVGAAGAELAALIMRSHMRLEGQGATLKIGDGVSTDLAPQLFGLLYSNEVLSDISIRGLTFDMNGANNPISPLRPTTYRRYQQAAIIFTGDDGVTAASGTDVLIEDCAFINNAGVSSIIMTLSNTLGVTIGKRWTLRNNRFWNNGVDTDDHSSVFAWADDVLASGNVFGADTMHATTGRTGVVAAYEVHGAHHRFVNNRVINTYRGMWVASNYTSPATDIVIQGNDFSPVRTTGVDFFRRSANASSISKVIIDANTFTLSDSYVAAGTLKAAVNMAQPADGYLYSNVSVTNNRVSVLGNAESKCLVVISTSNVADQKLDDLVVSGNTAVGTSSGVYIKTGTVNGLGRIVVQGNTFIDLTPATFAASPVGVFVGYVTAPSAIDHLTVAENRVVDTRTPTQTTYGVRMEGTITAAELRGNTIAGAATAVSNVATITSLTGELSRTAYTPVWYIGATPITVVDGTVGGYYVVRGDQVTVYLRYTIGASDTIPAGNMNVSLPFPAAVSNVQYLGHWRIGDKSESDAPIDPSHPHPFQTGQVAAEGTLSVAYLQIADGKFVGPTLPITLAAGDKISVQLTYQR